MPDFLPYAYFQGQIVPFAEAKISIATHALHYGTAAFGGLRGIPIRKIRIKCWCFAWIATADG